MEKIEIIMYRIILIVLMAFCPTLTVWAENRVKIETAFMKAGEATEIPIFLENTDIMSSLQMDITLPKGISYMPESLVLNTERVNSNNFDIVVTNVTDKYSDEDKKELSAEGIYRLLILTKDGSSFVGNSGLLASIKLNTALDFMQHAKLNVVKITGSYEAEKINIPDCLNVELISLNAINMEAYTRLAAQIASLQDAFDTAQNIISEECTDVTTLFTEQIGSIQASIDALTADVKTKYDNVVLNAESTVDTASIETAIEKLLTEAKAAQKAYEEEQAKIAANEEAYTKLTAQIASLQDAFDTAQNIISEECTDVTTQFTEQIGSIQASIDVLTADVKTKYDNVELNAESTIDTASITTAIEKLLTDAKTAQKEYEEGLSIDSVTENSKVVGIYTLTGKKISETQKGQIYLFRYENGKTVKKLVK